MIIRIYQMEGYTPSICLGIIDDYESFNFTKSFKKTGDWELKGLLTPKIAEILKPNVLIYVNNRICGLVDGVEFETNEQGDTTYTARGSELKNILSYRVIWESTIISPGYEPKVEFWLRYLVWYNCIPARGNFEKGRELIHHLDVPNDEYWNDTVIGTPKLYYFNNQGDNLLSTATEICQKNKTLKNLELGFDVVCNKGKEFIFTLYEGQDRTSNSSNPLIFSREYDNVNELCYTRSNKNTVNIVRVVGENDSTIVGESNNPTGISRREKLIDISQEGRTIQEQDGNRELTPEEYHSKLQTEGFKNLVFDINNMEALIVSNKNELPDYSLLGAKVTLLDKKYNLKLDDWISEINFIDENGDIEVNYTIGEDIQARILKEVK